MNYIDEIFERANLQHIREFLRTGGELAKVDNTSYYDRLKNCDSDFINIINSKFPSFEEQNPIKSAFFVALGIHENVYFEIGMQVGSILSKQLFNYNERGKE